MFQALYCIFIFSYVDLVSGEVFVLGLFLFLAGNKQVNLPFVGIGNCLGWSSPSLPLMMSPEFFLDITETEASVVTSLLGLGGMFGPLLAACLLDVVGRKYTVVIDQILMLASWIIMLCAWRIEMLYISRFVGGVTVAMTFSAVPLYVAEISEPKLRGLLSALTLPTRTASMLFAYVIGPFVSYYHLIILSAVAPMVFLILSPWMRESPYFLVSKGQRDKAKESLSWLRGGISEDACTKEIDNIQDFVEKSKAERRSFTDLVTSETNRRAILLTIVLMIFQQMSGLTVVLFYLESIFKSTVSTIPSSLSAIIVGVAMFVVGLISPPIIKKYGYTKPLIFSATGSGMAMGLLGLYFFLTERNINGPILNWLPVISVLSYMFLFNFAFTNIPWVIMGEVFPPNIKSHAASLCTSVCFFLGYITAQCFPLLLNLFGNDYAFWFHGSFCFISVVYIYYFVPETKGLSLREIQQVISKPLWGGKSSIVTTTNCHNRSLSVLTTDTTSNRSLSVPMTITANGKSPLNDTASPKLNGTYTSKKCADFICHV